MALITLGQTAWSLVWTGGRKEWMEVRRWVSDGAGVGLLPAANDNHMTAHYSKWVMVWGL